MISYKTQPLKPEKFQSSLDVDVNEKYLVILRTSSIEYH